MCLGLSFFKLLHSCSLSASILVHLPFVCPQEEEETDTKSVLCTIIYLLKSLSNHAECDCSLHCSQIHDDERHAFTSLY